MIIETTLNIENNLIERINHVARQKGISRNELIILIFKKVMDDAPRYVRHGKRIQYQSRHNHGEWHTFHIQLRQNDYECILDLRKLLKMSVSLILVFGIMKYLDALIKMEITDNYHYTNYMIIKEIIDGIQCWRLIWGFPRNPEIFFCDY